MLVMPCAHDQFDNAPRATRLGIARTISQRQYTPARIPAELRLLLETQEVCRSAAGIGDWRKDTARGRAWAPPVMRWKGCDR